MIKIIVELWPLGFEQNKKILGEMEIANDTTGTRTQGNYSFRISKQGNEGIWKRGSLIGFPRKQKNVWHLLFLCLKSAIEKEKE